jgi:hypothetical protein
MALTNAEHQKKHRARVAERLARVAALEAFACQVRDATADRLDPASKWLHALAKEVLL